MEERELRPDEKDDLQGPDAEDLRELGEEGPTETARCPSCGKDIHEDADRCPHCGLYIVMRPRGLKSAGWILLVILLLIVGGMIVLALRTWL